jgi:hypothetical protein
MTSSGSAHAQFIPDRAFANSAMNTTIFAPWGWNNGRIVWRPIINDRVSGGAGAVGNRWRPVRNRDPIMVSGMDAAGNALWTESFFDVFLELTGDLDWGTGGLMVNDPSGPVDMQLKIDMSSPFTAQHGVLDLDIRDGIVHTSVGTGEFSTLSLPPVGWNVGNLFTLPGLTNEFNLDYDLISLGAVQELKFELSGDGSGIVPEPAALVFFSLGGMFLMRRRNS